MHIEVVTGTGEGRTPLGAFDAALRAANVHDYNLVTLSSVVPAGATVAVEGTHGGDYAVGDVVAVVMSRAVSTEPGSGVWAGLGWALAPEGGVFMEATAETEAACEASLRTSLDDARTNRDWDWGPEAVVETAGHTVEDVGAAVVVAVYGRLALEGLDRSRG